jgi:hypothetical protein
MVGIALSGEVRRVVRDCRVGGGFAATRGRWAWAMWEKRARADVSWSNAC